MTVPLSAVCVFSSADLGADLDRLRNVADLHAQVQPDLLRRVDLDFLHCHRLEPRRFRPEPVRARFQEAEGVHAGRRGLRAEPAVRVDISESHDHVRHDRAGGIGNHARNAAAIFLRRAEESRSHRQQRQPEDSW